MITKSDLGYTFEKREFFSNTLSPTSYFCKSNEISIEIRQYEKNRCMHILICQHCCYIVIIMTVFEDLCEHTISNISLLSVAVRRRITL